MRGRLALTAAALTAVLVLVVLVVLHVHASPSPVEVTGPKKPTVAPSSGSTAANGFDIGGESSPDLFAIIDRKTLVRASRGSCHGTTDAVVEVSRDGGATFDGGQVPGLVQALAVTGVGRGDIEVVGLDARCAVYRFTSTDRGARWSRTAGDAGTWHLFPGARHAVFTPRGSRPTPCVPIALSPSGPAVARLLCARGRLFGTTDVGLHWGYLGRLPGAVGIDYVSVGGAVGLARQAGCPAAVMQTVDGGTTWARLICLPASRPAAIDVQGRVVAAQVHGRVFVSDDAGATFHTP
jgi:hypothetical protein